MSSSAGSPTVQAAASSTSAARNGSGHLGVHHDPLDGDAELPGVDEGAERGLLRRPHRVDAGVDDEGVLAAVLEQQLRRARTGHLRDPPARPGRADVGDDIDARVRDEPLADRAVALDEHQHALGQVPGEGLGEGGAHQRAPLRRLVHDGVPRRQGGGKQPGGDRHRVVPGGDHRDHAAGLPADDVDRPRVPAEGPAGVERGHGGRLLQERGGHLDSAARVGEQPAGVAGVEAGEPLGVRAEVGGGGAQGGGAGGGGGAPPAGQRGSGRRHGRRDLVVCGGSHTAVLGAGRRVDGHDG